MTTEQIWNDHGTKLERFIRSKVKDENKAQDILQDVFIKIHLQLGTLKDESRLTSWVYQITRNAVQDHFRKQRFFLDPDEFEVTEEKDNTETGKFLNCMMPFINRLPEKYQQAIILSDLNGLSQLRLAEKLKISYSGAKSRVQRARQLLHSYFTKCCDIKSDKYGNIISHIPKSKCLCNA
jgi:RNA polymerase sigma-70 factor (ECF subfamily)